MKGKQFVKQIKLEVERLIGDKMLLYSSVSLFLAR